MKRVLMLASVSSMIEYFNMSNIQILQELGYHVDVACNFTDTSTNPLERIHQFQQLLSSKNITYYQVDFTRDVKNLTKDIISYRQIKQLLTADSYEFIHCHSPIGGVIGRLAARKMHVKVIYTAHGFHFFKGAPLFNWLAYYTIERILSRYTDLLITINQEDFIRAKNFHARRTAYIPGIGIDIDRFSITGNPDQKRKELKIKEEDIALLSIGELNQGKNHRVIIEALSKLNNPNVKYFICGRGSELDNLRGFADKLQVKNQVFLLGFRSDITEICSAMDIFVFPSKREGLSVALMEAMAAGLPVICSDIRGNRDLIQNGKGGYLIPYNDSEAFSEKMAYLIQHSEARTNMGKINKKTIKKFSLKKVNERMKKLYLSMID